MIFIFSFWLIMTFNEKLYIHNQDFPSYPAHIAYLKFLILHIWNTTEEPPPPSIPLPLYVPCIVAMHTFMSTHLPIILNIQLSCNECSINIYIDNIAINTLCSSNSVGYVRRGVIQNRSIVPSDKLLKSYPFLA